jgi:hypothetical protein
MAIEQRTQEIVVRNVEIDLTRSAYHALIDTGRILHVEPKIVAEMPQATSSSVEIYLFDLDCDTHVFGGDVDKWLAVRGFRYVDPHTLAVFGQERELSGSDWKCNRGYITFWKDSAGKWCEASFGYRDPGQSVLIRHCDPTFYLNQRRQACVRL